MNCGILLVEVWGRYSKRETTRVYAVIRNGCAEISRRQERGALRRIHAIGGDVLECYSRPDGWTGRLPKIWVRG